MHIPRIRGRRPWRPGVAALLVPAAAGGCLALLAPANTHSAAPSPTVAGSPAPTGARPAPVDVTAAVDLSSDDGDVPAADDSTSPSLPRGLAALPTSVGLAALCALALATRRTTSKTQRVLVLTRPIRAGPVHA